MAPQVIVSGCSGPQVSVAEYSNLQVTEQGAGAHEQHDIVGMQWPADKDAGVPE